MKSPRRIAYDILLKMQNEQSYSNLILDSILSSSGLDARDRSFVSRLVYGTVERKITLDYILLPHLSQPIQKLKPRVLIILRMAIYQLYFMERVPDAAVLNEAVNLTKETGLSFASSLVNAVLHKVIKNPIDFENQTDLSVQYSCPTHLIRMWEKMYGSANTLGILQSLNEAPPITIRVNTLKSTAMELKQSLEASGIAVQTCDLPCALKLSGVSGIAGLEQFKDGLFHVQDLASQLCVQALDAKEEDVIFDLCASPGGKAFTIAQQMSNKGQVYAFDLYEKRLGLIEDGANRLGITSITAKVNDATQYSDDLPMADKILCDVPCSGLGIIGKKPEIRYKDLDSIKELPSIQLSILHAAVGYLKEGGTLLYSTCALNQKENEQVITAFLEQHEEFVLVPVLPQIERASGLEGSATLTLFPHVHQTDGFFIAKLERGASTEN